MNNKKILGLVLAILIIAGLVFAFTRKDKDDQAEKSNTSTQESMKNKQNEDSPKSIKSLLGTKDTSCTFTNEINGGKSEGVVFVADGKMRGDFTITTGGTTQGSHMITTANEYYMWMDGQKTGYKMSTGAATNPDQSASPQQGIDQNQPLNMKCSSWKVDASKFELPKDVDFMDPQSLTQSLPKNSQTTTDIKALQKKACESLPEPSKTQCLANIK